MGVGVGVGMGRLLGDATERWELMRVSLGEWPSLWERPLSFPGPLVCNELQVPALQGSEISSHNDGGELVATDRFLHSQRASYQEEGG